jgi:hypothetical protein
MAMMRNGRLRSQHRQLKQRFERMEAAPPPPPPALPGASRDDVERLERRVRVLERIVTDSGYTLASQIEALRDDRRIEQPEEERI